MYNRDTVALAKRMYLTEGRGIESIAQELRVAVGTVQSWKRQGQWEIEEEKNEDAKNFAGNAYKFAAFLHAEIENQVRQGNKIDAGQIKMFDILMSRIENVIKLDTELRKAESKENETDNIPPEVKNLPEVRKALEVIENATFAYNNRKEKRGF